MGFNDEIQLTDRQKQILIGVALAVLLVGGGVTIWMLRPKSYNMEVLKKFRDNPAYQPTAEEVKDIAALTGYKQGNAAEAAKIRAEATQYLSRAPVGAVAQVAQNPGDLSTEAQARLDEQWVKQDAKAAAPHLEKKFNDPNADRDRKLGVVSAAGQAPDISATLPVLESAVKSSDDAVAEQAMAVLTGQADRLLESGQKPSKALLEELNKLANDPAKPERVRKHSARAVIALTQGTAKAGTPYSNPFVKNGPSR
jgi:hypothetical protein